MRVLGRELRRTPGTLMGALVAIWVLTLATFLLARADLTAAADAATTIAGTAEPSVVNARQIASSLTDMHAHVANAFLLGFQEHSDDWDIYAAERQVVANTLAVAAPSGAAPETVQTLQTLARDFGLYQDRVARAADNQAQNYPVGLAYFREADALVTGSLLPAADGLARSNDAVLQQRASIQVSGARVLVAASLLVLVLFATQVYVALRMRRAFNVPLALATLLGVWLMAQASSTLDTAARQLAAARTGPYASLLTLSQARVMAYSANTDKSLWLLSQHDPSYQTAFDQSALAMTNPRLTPQLSQAFQAGLSRPTPIAFNGLLATGLRNVTPDQRQVALQAAAAWADYLNIDAQLRQLELGGDHTGAVALATGGAAGQSNGALGQFDAAIGRLIDADQQQFDRLLQQTEDGLGGGLGAATLLPILALGIAALAWLGLQPRIAEYR